MSGPENAKLIDRHRERLLVATAISLLVILATCSGFITLLEVPLRLLIGWALHAWATLPPLLSRWGETLLPLACLALTLVLAHRFIRWWFAAKGVVAPWYARHTLATSALPLLGAAAAIAMSGIVHQAVWLAGEPWWMNRGRNVRTVAFSNARQILLALMDFKSREGRYPESLAELDLPPDLVSLSPRPRGLPESFVYLKPDSDPLPDEEVLLIVSPVLPSESQVVVGFSSGAARTIPAETLPKVLETRRIPNVKSDE